MPSANLVAALRQAQEAAATLVSAKHATRPKAARRVGTRRGRPSSAIAVCRMRARLATSIRCFRRLYHLPEVRKAVYAFQYEGEAVHGNKDLCVPLQLAALFARLQISTCQAASTRALTASFGWSRAESFRQHDVQELCRVLFTALSKFGVGIESDLSRAT